MRVVLTRKLFPSIKTIFQRTMSTEGKLTHPDGSYIFYKRRLAAKQGKPGIIFCSGYASNLNGNKARFLDDYCVNNGLAYIRFDYMGHEFSSGTLDDVTISLWKENTLNVLDQLTEGPQIIVGSSMGGWVSLLTAIERPSRVVGLVSIANASDMLYRRYSNFSSEVKEEIDRLGYFSLDQYGYTDDGRVPLKFFKDSHKHLLLESSEKIPITCSVRLLHGMQDHVVPFETSLEVANKLESNDVQVVLDKTADHRFSSTNNLKLLAKVLDDMLTSNNQNQSENDTSSQL